MIGASVAHDHHRLGNMRRQSGETQMEPNLASQTPPAQARLLEAAHEVFEERGLDQTHMSDIAQRAGIAKGHIYNFYRNKDQLYLAVHHRAALSTFKSLEPRLKAASSREEQVRAVATKLLDAAFRVEKVRRLPLDLCERAIHDAVLREEVMEVRTMLNERIRQLFVDAGLLSGDDPMLGRCVMVILSALLSYLPLAVQMEPELGEVEVLARIIDALLLRPE